MGKNKPPQFEKEKIIDKRIGMRLKSIFWPLDRTAINEILQKLNYKEITISGTGSFNAVKHGTEFYTDYSKMVFGFHNRNVTSLIESQKEFFSVTKREYDVDLSKFIRFYEIESISNIISAKNTNDVYSKISQDFSFKNIMEDVLGKPMRIHKMELSKPEPIENENWYQIEISPRSESQGKIHFCRLLARDEKTDVVYSLLRKSSEYFEEIIQKMES